MCWIFVIIHVAGTTMSTSSAYALHGAGRQIAWQNNKKRKDFQKWEKKKLTKLNRITRTNESDEHGGSREFAGGRNRNDGRAYIVSSAIFSVAKLHRANCTTFSSVRNFCIFLRFLFSGFLSSHRDDPSDTRAAQDIDKRRKKNKF